MPQRRTLRLRSGRTSQAGATYFVTLCIKEREQTFIDADSATQACATLTAFHHDHDVDVLAATIMPDHVHLLFRLGPRLRLGQVIGKFKSAVRPRGPNAWHWQEDGFEHHLRPHETTEDYGFYIFMNPYRAGFLPLSDRWHWWLCPDPERFHFLSHLAYHQPVPGEWIHHSTEVGARLEIRL